MNDASGKLMGDAMGDPGRRHQPVGDHGHRHDRWCGHATLAHGDHMDFLHDGQVHHPCTDHVDEISTQGPGAHLSHSAHMHVHTSDCGHEVVSHEDHLDFLHGRHRHAAHTTHYDEH